MQMAGVRAVSRFTVSGVSPARQGAESICFATRECNSKPSSLLPKRRLSGMLHFNTYGTLYTEIG